MKTTRHMFLAFVVLLALALSAHVLANPAAIAYGAQTPIVQEELKELRPQAAMPGDVSVFTEDGQAVGFRAADNLRVTVCHGLALKFSATTLNLANEETHRVYFGFPGAIDYDTFVRWSDRPDIIRKLREARKDNPGVWVLGFPVGGNRWECWVPSSILPINQTTQVILKLEGKFNHKRIKVLLLITIGRDKQGRYEERMEIACVEPPPDLATMPRELIFTHLMGFAPAWAAPVMSSNPGMGGPMIGGPAPEPGLTRSEFNQTLSDFRTSVLGDVRQVVREELGSARSAPTITAPPDAQEQGVSGEEPATTGLLAIRPDGGYRVLDRENDDQWVISRTQRVYVYFNRSLGPGEVFEFGIDSTDGEPQYRVSVPGNETAGNYFFLTFTDPATLSLGEHTLFVRVTGPNDEELANTSQTLVIQEGNQ